jgi:hypothetical protein
MWVAETWQSRQFGIVLDPARANHGFGPMSERATEPGRACGPRRSSKADGFQAGTCKSMARQVGNFIAAGFRIRMVAPRLGAIEGRWEIDDVVS